MKLTSPTATRRGRCQSQRPAWDTGKPLSQKQVILDLRDHAFAKAPYLLAGSDEARAALPDLTWGRLAQVVIITVGHIQGFMIQEALSLTAKGGPVVVTGMGHWADKDVTLNMFELTLLQKRVQGAIFGVVKAAIDRGTAEGTRKLTGVWPGENAEAADRS